MIVLSRRDKLRLRSLSSVKSLRVRTNQPIENKRAIFLCIMSSNMELLTSFHEYKSASEVTYTNLLLQKK